MKNCRAVLGLTVSVIIASAGSGLHGQALTGPLEATFTAEGVIASLAFQGETFYGGGYGSMQSSSGVASGGSFTWEYDASSTTELVRWTATMADLGLTATRTYEVLPTEFGPVLKVSFEAANTGAAAQDIWALDLFSLGGPQSAALPVPAELSGAVFGWGNPGETQLYSIYAAGRASPMAFTLTGLENGTGGWVFGSGSLVATSGEPTPMADTALALGATLGSGESIASYYLQAYGFVYGDAEDLLHLGLAGTGGGGIGTPIPEPTTVAAWSGLAVLAAVVWQRRRRRR